MRSVKSVSVENQQIEIHVPSIEMIKKQLPFLSARTRKVWRIKVVRSSDERGRLDSAGL